MHYAKALAVAGLLIVAGAGYAWLTLRSFDSRLRQSLRQQQRAGTLPPELQGVDIETVDVRGLVAIYAPDLQAAIQV
jgi:hypothetical protein